MSHTVIYFTDSTEFGGAEQALLHLLAGLDRQQWQPILFHHPSAGLAPLLEGASSMAVELQAVPGMPLGKQGAMAIPQFVRRLRALHPAVFHAHLTWPLSCKYELVSAILARIPAIVATLHLFVELPYDFSTRQQQRLIATGIHRYIAVSHHISQRWHETFRIPQRKFAVINNAIPLDAFQRRDHGEARASLWRTEGHPIILTVARLDKQKGHCYLLQAATRIPDALFVFVGDGPERPGLEILARELGLNDRVIFLGHQRDVIDLLASCDAFVLPSLYEGFPLSILEAMAAGKPVIASAIAGNDEVITDGQTGLLVPPADPIALAHAIATLLSDQALAQRLALAGRARIYREFSLSAMVQRVTRIYEEALHSRETEQHVYEH
jgi:glycosyltransferase involved in cell wall biosynthesis